MSRSLVRSRSVMVALFFLGLGLVAATTDREGEFKGVVRSEVVDVQEKNNSVLQLRAAPGKRFVLLTWAMQPGRSLGRYDYQLKSGSQAFKAILVGMEGQPFAPADWEFICEDARSGLLWAERSSAPPGSRECAAATLVTLVFEVPANVGSATLESRLIEGAATRPLMLGGN